MSARARDTHAVSLIERELPLATYVERFPLGPQLQLPSQVRFRDRVLGEALSDLPGSETPSAGFT